MFLVHTSKHPVPVLLDLDGFLVLNSQEDIYHVVTCTSGGVGRLTDHEIEMKRGLVAMETGSKFLK